MTPEQYFETKRLIEWHMTIWEIEESGREWCATHKVTGKKLQSATLYGLFSLAKLYEEGRTSASKPTFYGKEC